jgi:REP element-mobilizing transposase RayT
MARPLRVDVPGGWYHVTARGNERKAIFRDDQDRRRFLAGVSEMAERFGVRFHAYVLMDNHYHLLVETPHANLSPAMQWLGVSYSLSFNHRHRRVGHLFQGRFTAVLLEPTAAVEVSRYVHLNPVRVRGLGLDKAAQQRSRGGWVEKPDAALIRERTARLRRYRWSSYPAYLELAERPAGLTTRHVLEMLGRGSWADRRKAYRQFVEAPLRDGMLESPWERLQAGVLLGSAEFVRRWRARATGDAREQPQFRRLQPRITFADVVRAVERLKAEPWEQFRDRYGDWGRDMVLWVARRHGGLRLRQLAQEIGGLDYGSVAMASKRFAKQLETDRSLRQHYEQLKRELLQ